MYDMLNWLKRKFDNCNGVLVLASPCAIPDPVPGRATA